MRAVTYQAPGEVRVEEKPEPEVGAPDEAVIRRINEPATPATP